MGEIPRTIELKFKNLYFVPQGGYRVIQPKILKCGENVPVPCCLFVHHGRDKPYE